MPIAEVGSIELYYESEGSGPAIFFISGLASGQTVWANVVKHLKHEYECITFDGRGIGQSSKPPSGYTIPDLSRDCIDLLEGLSIKRVHLVGMSMGGLIAQDMALQYPEIIGSLILAGSFAKTTARGDLVQETRKVLKKRLDPYEFFLIQATWMFGPDTLSKPGFAENYARKMADNPHPQVTHAFDQMADGVSRFDTLERLKDINRPTLVIVGEENIMATPTQSRVLAEGIPGAELVVLPKLGHFCLITEGSRQFANCIGRFIKSVDTP